MKVEFPQYAIDKIRPILEQTRQLEASMKNYILGLRDGMGLDGDYNADIGTMSFIKHEEAPDGKATVE